MYHALFARQACLRLHGTTSNYCFIIKPLTLVYDQMFIIGRIERDLIDKYGAAIIENEFYVNKNILRPTQRVREHIETLSNIKYRESPRRYVGELIKQQ